MVETKVELKKTLNSISGVYICINLVNDNMYVGSASLTGMYRRFRGHLYFAKGGSLLVNRAVKKYGVENFAFIVIETVSADKLKCKNTLLPLPTALHLPHSTSHISGMWVVECGGAGGGQY